MPLLLIPLVIKVIVLTIVIKQMLSILCLLCVISLLLGDRFGCTMGASGCQPMVIHSGKDYDLRESLLSLLPCFPWPILSRHAQAKNKPRKADAGKNKHAEISGVKHSPAKFDSLHKCETDGQIRRIRS